MIRVNDFSEYELNIFNNLSETALKTINEPKPGLFIAESPKVIERAYASGYKPVSMLVDESECNEECMSIVEMLENDGITVYEASHDMFSKITGANLTRGALCAFERKEYPAFSDKIKGLSRIVIMEDIVNPTNLGAIFRSAAALGIEAVLLTGACTDPLYRRSERVSMGTVFQVPFTYIDDVESVLPYLQSVGFKTVSFALRNNSIDIDDPSLKAEDKLCIIMGTEGEGLKSDTINNSDYVVKIPMYNSVDSLNVAAASAIAFWELGPKHNSDKR